MGCTSSKMIEDEDIQKIHHDISDNNIVDPVKEYERQMIEIMVNDLEDKPTSFVLNNVLMCMQFFKNYNNDVLKVGSASGNNLESKFNTNLLKEEKMKCTSPDIIFDKVYENIRYRPMHGPDKFSSRPLVAKRLYVINDTIEVINSMDIPQYTSIDKPAYQVRIEDSKRAGFVRLKFMDTKFPKLYSERGESPQPCSSKSSDSGLYDYSTITELKTPKPLNVMNNPESRDSLPETCFITKKIKKKETNIDENLALSDIPEEVFFDEITYLDSKGFFSYFKNALFPNSLGKALGFDDSDIYDAKAIPGKIFCNMRSENDDTSIIPCEVLPSVAVEWPAEQTFEFVMREERPTIIDPTSGFRYKWPTDEMIREIQSMNCVLVPTGYWLKKGEYQDSTIEWEIAFPKAEKHIETRMSHAQIKCYLFLLALHKTFIEPATQQHGLLVEHIRYHMYWECESNYRDWPEHRLGTKLRKIITSLNNRLSKAQLPHYFIKQRNMFENTPRKYLQYAQKIFHDLLEEPIMYFLRALRNIRYTSGMFYNTVNFKELYKILKQKEGINILNPDAINRKLPNALSNINQRKYDDADTQWKHLKQLKYKEKILKKREIELARKTVSEADKRNDSLDSIDLTWISEKYFDVYKKKVLITIFITNFIQLAKDSSKFDCKNQSLFYLKQAWYLTKVLEILAPSFQADVQNFQKTIRTDEEKYMIMAAKAFSEIPPSTPVRNLNLDFTQSQRNSLNLNIITPNSTGTSVTKEPSFKLKPIITRTKYTAKDKSVQPRKSIAFIEPIDTS